MELRTIINKLNKILAGKFWAFGSKTQRIFESFEKNFQIFNKKLTEKPTFYSNLYRNF